MQKPLVLHLAHTLAGSPPEFLDERARTWREAALVLAADGADHGRGGKNVADDEASRTAAAFASAAHRLRRPEADRAGG